MNKLWLIIQREYLVRVRQKTFLLTTLLTPLGFGLMFLIVLLSAKYTQKENYKIYVVDPTSKVYPKLKSESNISFVRSEKPLEALKEIILSKKDEAVLVLPSDLTKTNVSTTIYAPRSLSIQVEEKIRSKLSETLREIKLIQAGVEPSRIAETEVKLSLTTVKLSEKGEEKTSAVLATGMGYAMSMMIYIMVFIYGTIVMKSVTEEKNNRIAEIIISSVKPIQLMFGKIIAVAAMGLTQIFFWIVLIFIIIFTIATIFGLSGGAESMPQQEEISPEIQQKMAIEITNAIKQFKVSLIFYFIFYFLGGYLMYASLFAAIGAASDSETENQQLVTIVSIPIIIPILFLMNVLQNPNSTLAFWLSIIPLFSPIIMMVRLASVDVSFWELLLSMLMLIGGVWGMSWVAAKIYRVGILLYGKKITLAEIGKWVFNKNVG